MRLALIDRVSLMSNLEVFSPYTGKIVGTVETCHWEEIDTWLNLKREILAPFERLEILERLYSLLQSERDDYINTAIAEGGKPRQDTEIEFSRALDGIKIAISVLRGFSGKQIPMGLTQASVNRVAFTVREPAGIVFAISAFNHPINLIIHQVIPAVATGCPVLVRPASKTPLSCFKLVQHLCKAGLQESFVKAIACDYAVTEKIVADKRLGFFSFIGSSTVGWRLRKLLAPGVNSAFEHGGAAPAIVCADADLEKSVASIVKGGFYHAGQVCVSVQRVFVEDSIASEFNKLLVRQVEKLVVGNPHDSKTEVGPLIGRSEIARLKDFIDDAITSGGQVLTGNQEMPGNCLAPTVIYNPSEKALISHKEIFGPVLAVYSFKDICSAINAANETEFVFQSSIMTKNLDTALMACRKLKATTVLVNDHTAFRADWMPFAGRRESGQGVGGIPFSMLEMSFEKQIIIKSENI